MPIMNWGIHCETMDILGLQNSFNGRQNTMTITSYQMLELSIWHEEESLNNFTGSQLPH